MEVFGITPEPDDTLDDIALVFLIGGDPEDIALSTRLAEEGRAGRDSGSASGEEGRLPSALLSPGHQSGPFLPRDPWDHGLWRFQRLVVLEQRGHRVQLERPRSR